MNHVLKEAKRLHEMGLGVLWIKPKSKRPVNEKWTSGPRESWEVLSRSYRPGFNVGVRLGGVSKIGSLYLGAVDVDVKSTDPRHRAEAEAAIKELFPEIADNAVQVMSGRGNGSSHIYILTEKPARPSKRRSSKEEVRVMMPSADINAKQRSLLSEEDLNEGWRIRPAWEVGIMGEGQQIILPPSLHPDSGKEYAWKVRLEKQSQLQTLDVSAHNSNLTRDSTNDWVPEEIDIVTSQLDSEIVDLIMSGQAEDRSSALFKAAIAMVKAGFTDRQIMTVLTDKEYGLGEVAFEHAKSRSRQRAANWVFNYTIKKARLEADAFLQFEAEVSESTLGEAEAEAQAAELLENDWRLSLDRTNFGTPRPTFKNMLMILRNDIGQGVFRRDLFANRDRYGCDTPWGGSMGHEVNDDDIILIKEWMTHRYRFEPSPNLIVETISAIALKNGFHPVRDYLQSLEWDGTPRIDTWLKDYVNAKGPEPYLAEVSRKILIAMIARVFIPGVKFDHIPILEGKQGMGKSSAAKILASPEWFADNIPDLRHADARLNLQGKWVVEMGELSKLKSSDLETIKAYIVSPVDRVRAPYGRKAFDLKRQSIFIGTTNESIYLKDKTGNRRYWPIKVGQCNFDGLENVRDQLFAEAMLMWDNFREPLYLDGEAKKQAEEVQAERVSEDEETMMGERFELFMEAELMKDEWERFNFSGFRMSDLFADFGPFSEWKPTMLYILFASKILKDWGFEKYRAKGSKKWRAEKGGRAHAELGTPPTTQIQYNV